LDARVARLRIERIGMTSRHLVRAAARGFSTRSCAICGLGAASFDTTTRSVFTGLRSDLASIRTGANSSLGRAASARARPGEIEAEELIGAIFVGPRGAARYQEPRAKCCRNSVFQAHRRPS